MIRKFRQTDIDGIMDIWLNANLAVHSFIPAEYWKGNFESVKEMLPQAEVYVYENGGEIQGFLGLSGNFIEGIFVSEKMWSHGIGKCLLDYVKAKKSELQLNVYRKNKRAIRFYEREGFEIQSEGVDESTDEKDYLMTWRQSRFF